MTHIILRPSFLFFFLQDNIHLLYQRAVAYLNVDSPVRGTVTSKLFSLKYTLPSNRNLSSQNVAFVTGKSPGTRGKLFTTNNSDLVLVWNTDGIWALSPVPF